MRPSGSRSGDLATAKQAKRGGMHMEETCGFLFKHTIFKTRFKHPGSSSIYIPLEVRKDYVRLLRLSTLCRGNRTTLVAIPRWKKRGFAAKEKGQAANGASELRVRQSTEVRTEC